MIFLKPSEIGLARKCLPDYRQFRRTFFCRHRTHLRFYTANTHTAISPACDLMSSGSDEMTFAGLPLNRLFTPQDGTLEPLKRDN